MDPIYLKSYESSQLQRKIEKALLMLRHCTLCPRKCKVNRIKGELGLCRTGRSAIVSGFNPHFGEEDPLVGSGGSGTIFFTNCNLLCAFCQNYEISHLGEGYEVEAKALAGIMMELQERGVHNINFVTPSHVVPQILEALPIAVDMGLRLPLVYNSSGYDSPAALKLLEGIIDIYMPDLKFADTQIANRYCKAPDYPEIAKKTIKEMYRQVGDLLLDKKGVALRGLLVRHLVMPDGKAGTKALMTFLAEEVSKNTYVNIMAQYRPYGNAYQYKELCRSIRADEYRKAIQDALDSGIRRLDERRSFPVF